MPERKELSTPRRARIKTLLLDAHWPKKKISRELGVPRRTTIVSQRDVRRMLIAIRRKYESRRLPYVELARSCGNNGQSHMRRIPSVWGSTVAPSTCSM